jgi:hypothetical protein
VKKKGEVWCKNACKILFMNIEGIRLPTISGCAPWRIDIFGALKSGKNVLEIEVANLWPNRLIGDVDKPGNQQFTWTVRYPYHARSELLFSGLLGLVHLSVVHEFQ